MSGCLLSLSTNAGPDGVVIGNLIKKSWGDRFGVVVDGLKFCGLVYVCWTGSIYCGLAF